MTEFAEHPPRRIDHVAEAEGLAQYALETHAGADVATALATRALAHATLALVEQTRAANLIALAELANRVPGADVTPVLDALGEGTARDVWAVVGR